MSISSNSSDEFSFISTYFSNLNADFNAKAQAMGLTLGIGDDGAILKLKDHYAITTDTLVEKVHFFSHINPFILGARSLEVNLSDLYAMGARAQFVLLSLNIPKKYFNLKEFWQEFSLGFASCLKRHNCALIGGNITSIPSDTLCISITALGKNINEHNYLARHNIQDNDVIVVTNYLGTNALYVDSVYQNLIAKLTSKEQKEFESLAYYYDANIQSILNYLALHAHAAIDVSDGLMGDLSHMLSRSSASATLNVDAIPLDSKIKLWAHKMGYSDQALKKFALNTGGDYNLVFTLSEEKYLELENMAQEYNFKLSCIGKAKKIAHNNNAINDLSTKTNLITLVDNKGKRLDLNLAQELTSASFNHFMC